MRPGTLMLVEDQVNLQWAAPGRMARDEALSGAALTGPVTARGLSSRPMYAPEILAKAAHAATTAGVRVERGVLGVMLGPSYETPAEIAMLERMGADAVCMSTAAEAAAACTLGLPVGAISCVTNWAAGKSPARLNHGDVTKAVAAASPALRSLLERLILALA
jgi:purine-nucleoside phosphorylase